MDVWLPDVGGSYPAQMKQGTMGTSGTSTIAPFSEREEVSGLGTQNLHANRSEKSRAQREAGNSHAWGPFRHICPHEAFMKPDTKYQMLRDHFLRVTFGLLQGEWGLL